MAAIATKPRSSLLATSSHCHVVRAMALTGRTCAGSAVEAAKNYRFRVAFCLSHVNYYHGMVLLQISCDSFSTFADHAELNFKKMSVYVQMGLVDWDEARSANAADYVLRQLDRRPEVVLNRLTDEDFHRILETLMEKSRFKNATREVVKVMVPHAQPLAVDQFGCRLLKMTLTLQLGDSEDRQAIRESLLDHEFIKGDRETEERASKWEFFRIIVDVLLQEEGAEQAWWALRNATKGRPMQKLFNDPFGSYHASALLQFGKDKSEDVSSELRRERKVVIQEVLALAKPFRATFKQVAGELDALQKYKRQSLDAMPEGQEKEEQLKQWKGQKMSIERRLPSLNATKAAKYFSGKEGEHQVPEHLETQQSARPALGAHGSGGVRLEPLQEFSHGFFSRGQQDWPPLTRKAAGGAKGKASASYGASSSWEATPVQVSAQPILSQAREPRGLTMTLIALPLQTTGTRWADEENEEEFGQELGGVLLAGEEGRTEQARTSDTGGKTDQFLVRFSSAPPSASASWRQSEEYSGAKNRPE